MDTIQDLIKFGIDSISEYNEKNSDMLHEIADGLVPVYHWHLIQMAAENYDLALNVPELGPAFDGSPINIIAANIYEAILNGLYEEFADQPWLNG